MMRKSSGRTILVGIIVVTSLIIGGAGPATATQGLSVSGSAGETSPGSSVVVTFNLTNYNDSAVSAPALEVTELPANWTVASHTDAGGTYQGSGTTWLWLNLGGGASVDPTLTLDVPEDADHGTYNISAGVYNASNVEVDNVTVEVTVSQQFQMSISDSKAVGGDVISIPVTVENSGSSVNGPAINVTKTPGDWAIFSKSSDGGTWSAASTSWVWISLGEGETLEPVIKTTVPKSAALGTYNVGVEMTVANQTKAKANATITVEEDSEAKYDKNGNDQMDSITELQTAISDWSKTDNLSITELQTLILKWASG